MQYASENVGFSAPHGQSSKLDLINVQSKEIILAFPHFLIHTVYIFKSITYNFTLIATLLLLWTIQWNNENIFSI